MSMIACPATEEQIDQLRDFGFTVKILSGIQAKTVFGLGYSSLSEGEKFVIILLPETDASDILLRPIQCLLAVSKAGCKGLSSDISRLINRAIEVLVQEKGNAEQSRNPSRSRKHLDVRAESRSRSESVDSKPGPKLRLCRD